MRMPATKCVFVDEKTGLREVTSGAVVCAVCGFRVRTQWREAWRIRRPCMVLNPWPLGDWMMAALGAVGVTPALWMRWTHQKECGCKVRAARLNQIGVMLYRVWLGAQRRFRRALPWLVLLAFVPIAQAGEREEAARIAAQWNAQTEVVLWDGTRVDILTDSTAWEVEWPAKWAESIGQALYYAEVSGKQPGIVLLVTDLERERRYVYRCQTVCAKYGIRLRVERLRSANRTP